MTELGEFFEHVLAWVAFVDAFEAGDVNGLVVDFLRRRNVEFWFLGRFFVNV